MIDGIRHSCCGTGTYGTAGAPARDKSQVASTLLAAQATSETDAEISITTDEGDTVTLSLQSEMEANFAFYRRPASGDGNGLQVASFDASSSRDIQITVQEDLNDQEKADIKALVKNLVQVIRDFVKGNFGSAVSRAFDGTAPDSLSSYTLHVDHSESLTVMQAVHLPPATVAAPAVSTPPTTVDPAGPQQIAAPLEPTDPPAGAAPVTDPSTTDAPSPIDAALKDVLDSMMRALRQSGVDVGRHGHLLRGILGGFLHRMGHAPGIEPARSALRELSAGFHRRVQDIHPEISASASETATDSA